MKLESINVGSEQQLGDLKTGIFKKPTSGGIHVSELGLHDDAICDTKYHGGVDQALYVYGTLDYDFWRENYQLELAPGTFGENLTISELSSLNIRVGDRFSIGDVRLEATAPRIPCGTLGRRMNDPKFPVQFRKSKRSGFYCRVLNSGELQPQMTVQFQPTDQETNVSIEELFELNYNPNPTKDEIARVLESPIAVRERERLLDLARKLSA